MLLIILPTITWCQTLLARYGDGWGWGMWGDCGGWGETTLFNLMTISQV